MKRLLAATALSILLLVAAMNPLASAHVLKVDGNIGAVMHILPDDNPKSGVPTTYQLSFSDTADKFLLANCNCNAAIKESGKTVFSQPLTATDPLDSNNTLTFPNTDVYTLAITGTPKQPGDFQPFELDYLVRVEAGATPNKKFPPSLAVGLAMLVALIFLGAYRAEQKSERT
jgi:hypothetical protein